MITKRVQKSATATARTLSHLLKENGFTEATNWHEGYYVDVRNNTVQVGYHALSNANLDRIHKGLQVAQMREVLFELGYISSHPHAIYIECLRR